MTEIDEISARLTVLETVMRQLITHMAVRDDNPRQWVRTRKTLALSTIQAASPGHAARLHIATTDFFDPAEREVGHYSDAATPGTTRTLVR